MEYCGKGENIPAKIKTCLSAGKVFTTIFWDAKGVVYIEFLF